MRIKGLAHWSAWVHGMAPPLRYQGPVARLVWQGRRPGNNRGRTRKEGLVMRKSSWFRRCGQLLLVAGIAAMLAGCADSITAPSDPGLSQSSAADTPMDDTDHWN
jgi:hypothetical protein